MGNTEKCVSWTVEIKTENKRYTDMQKVDILLGPSSYNKICPIAVKIGKY